MEKEDILNTKTEPSKVHVILAHSYLLTFFLFLIGIILDFSFRLEFFRHTSFAYTGTLLILLGTLLIFWAQKTSRRLDIKNLTKKTFLEGPYGITRSPTHWGLLFLTAGFGIIGNAFFIVLTSIIAFIISKMIFLKKEEKILAKKYGAPYLEYKKQIKY